MLLILYEGKGSEMYYEKETAEKPEKWPANAREQILDTLCECVEKFEKNPSYFHSFRTVIRTTSGKRSLAAVISQSFWAVMI